MVAGKGQVVVLMGSKSDLEHAHKVEATLNTLGVPVSLRVASAHKTVQHLLAILGEYEQSGPVVYVAIAGRSNALAGMVDANTVFPVITCPPAATAFGGADIYSSLRMPSGVAPLVILEPESAALAAAKILALDDASLARRVADSQAAMARAVEEADKSLRE